jgi:hypothetical protein
MSNNPNFPARDTEQSSDSARRPFPGPVPAPNPREYSVNLNVNVTMKADESLKALIASFGTKLDSIIASVKVITSNDQVEQIDLNKLKEMGAMASQQVQDLQQELQRNGSLVASIAQIVTTLVDEVQAAKDDPAQLDQILTDFRANDDLLAQAAIAGTPGQTQSPTPPATPAPADGGAAGGGTPV